MPGVTTLQVSSDESERLIKMEETLHQRVIGQEEAVVAISRAIRRARVGLKNPNRPIASFIFSGPTGGNPPTANSCCAAIRKLVDLWQGRFLNESERGTLPKVGLCAACCVVVT